MLKAEEERAPVIFAQDAGISWKGFDFSFFLQGMAGMKTVYQGLEWRTNVNKGNMLSQEIVDGRSHTDLLDADGNITKPAVYPRLLEQTNKINSDTQSDFWLISQVRLCKNG